LYLAEKNVMENKSSRREFFKQSATAVIGVIVLPQIIPSSALGMGGRLAPSDRIVMGAIGVGSQGSSNMRNFLRRTKDVQFIAVCDVDTSFQARAKNSIDKANANADCRVYGDYREFLEKEKLDAVSIAIPDHWHGLIYTAAANKKLHIYGEKPLARSIYESKAIVNAVKKNKIIFQTGSWQRSQPNFLRGAELVRNGRVGKINYVEVGLPDGGINVGTPPVMEVPKELNWEMWLGPAPKVQYRGTSHGNWRWILDYSGGQMTDWAGHHIDIAQWGLGTDRTGPAEIFGKGFYAVEGLFNVPVEYDFTCKYAMRVANKSRISVKHVFAGENQGATWYGQKGWIHVDRGGQIAASDPKILNEVIGEKEIHLYKSTDHWGNFIDCIRSGEETVAPVEVAHRAISIALLGEIAMTTGQIIKWDPIKEEIIGNPMANRLLSRPYRQPWTL
jgi:predicted dehydrogenase